VPPPGQPQSWMAGGRRRHRQGSPTLPGGQPRPGGSQTRMSIWHDLPYFISSLCSFFFFLDKPYQVEAWSSLCSPTNCFYLRPPFSIADTHICLTLPAISFTTCCPSLLTDKTRKHLRSASVRTYTFSPRGFPRFLSICGARGSLALNQALI
jgi:hypothetical protein